MIKYKYLLLYLSGIILGIDKNDVGGAAQSMVSLESKEEVVQNLKDAGCGMEGIQDFLSYLEKNQKEKQLEFLEHHRKQLLNNVHTEEKKIYCLDYLAYQIKK